MSHEPILKVTGLSETQVCAIGFGAEYSELADLYSLKEDDVYREATLAALERKGYLGKKQAMGGHRWLTKAGLAVRQDFDRAHHEKHPERYYD